jgi:hypothetical protein
MHCGRLSLLAALLAGAAEASSFTVAVDVADVPNAQAYVAPVKTLITEWYSKINTILFGKAPLPFAEVRVVFRKTLEADTPNGRVDAPAFTHGNVISVNFTDLVRMNGNYRAMLIHELAHVCQNYKGLDKGPAKWVGEGIADYIRHKYFERDLESKLEWDPDGTIKDGPLERAALAKQGYLVGYTIAAPFLYWLELHKNPRIVVILSQDVRDGSFSSGVFASLCGAPLDALWQKFFDQK